MCNQAAFGINSISGWYNRRMDKVIPGIGEVHKIVDDVLMYAPSLFILKKRTCAFLDQCRYHGVTLMKPSLERAVTKVEFGGFCLSKTGIQTSPGVVKSVGEYPRPRDLTDLRVWFELVYWLSNFSKELTAMAPFRPIHAMNAVFRWLPEYDFAFVGANPRVAYTPVLT